MRSHHLALLSWLAAAPAALAQSPEPAPNRPSAEVRAMTQAILKEVDEHSQLMANLEYLCDVIGPRLTGSDNLKRANEWTRDKFNEYGLQNAKLEPWKIARGWTRGTASGQVVSPTRQRLLLESAGWSPGTPGVVRGPVVHLKAGTMADLDTYKGKLKGAWVIQGAVSVLPSPKNPVPNANRPAPTRTATSARPVRPPRGDGQGGRPLPARGEARRDQPAQHGRDRPPLLPAQGCARFRRRPRRGRVSQDPPHRERHLRQGVSRRGEPRRQGPRRLGLQRRDAARPPPPRPQTPESPRDLPRRPQARPPGTTPGKPVAAEAASGR